MEAILQWGLDCIRFIQTFASPPLTVIMRGITLCGEAPLYIAVLPFVYWCVNEKKGVRLTVMVLISVWVNISLKFLLDQPRPFFPAYDPALGMIPERMGGFPSGHAQNSLVLCFIIASWAHRRLFYGIAALVCFFIGFSRIYLGVHFPTDVLGGWIIGAALLCAYFFLAGKIETFCAHGGFRAGMVSCAALSFLMILYLPGEEILVSGGTMLGMGAGYCLNLRYVGFRSAEFSVKTGAAKYLAMLVCFALGFTCAILILVVFEKLNLRNHFPNNYKLIGFARFALAGLWISAGAPWLFRKLRLVAAAP